MPCFSVQREGCARLSPPTILYCQILERCIWTKLCTISSGILMQGFDSQVGRLFFVKNYGPSGNEVEVFQIIVHICLIRSEVCAIVADSNIIRGSGPAPTNVYLRSPISWSESSRTYKIAEWTPSTFLKIQCTLKKRTKGL